LKIAAIIPVKVFAKAKTRLNLSDYQRLELCKLMFEEVINTVCKSEFFDPIIVVSKEPMIIDICKQSSLVLLSDNETGVNDAVSIADNYLEKIGIDASVVLPQDIPLMQTRDIAQLLELITTSKSVLVVPSRKFDGTNALVRNPANIMKTHYDEDSYKIHIQTAKSCNARSSLVLIRRIMADIDNSKDLKFVLDSQEKPNLIKKIRTICNLE